MPQLIPINVHSRITIHPTHPFQNHSSCCKRCHLILPRNKHFIPKLIPVLISVGSAVSSCAVRRFGLREPPSCSEVRFFLGFRFGVSFPSGRSPVRCSLAGFSRGRAAGWFSRLRGSMGGRPMSTLVSVAASSTLFTSVASNLSELQRASNNAAGLYRELCTTGTSRANRIGSITNSPEDKSATGQHTDKRERITQCVLGWIHEHKWVQCGNGSSETRNCNFGEGLGQLHQVFPRWREQICFQVLLHSSNLYSCQTSLHVNK